MSLWRDMARAAGYRDEELEIAAEIAEREAYDREQQREYENARCPRCGCHPADPYCCIRPEDRER